MTKRFFQNKLWAVIGLCLMFALSSSSAFAWEGHGRGRYHYRGGRWYRSGWFGLEFVVSAPRIGVVVESLPAGYTTVIVTDTPYYYYDRVYYKSCPNGYIVVPAPAAAPAVTAVPAYPVRQAVNPYYIPVTKIAEMASQNVPDAVIISEIQRTHSTYHLTSETISYLKQNKVSDQVINYMMGR